MAKDIVMSCNMDNRRNNERQMDGCVFVAIRAKKKESQGCQMLQMQHQMQMFMIFFIASLTLS